MTIHGLCSRAYLPGTSDLPAGRKGSTWDLQRLHWILKDNLSRRLSGIQTFNSSIFYTHCEPRIWFWDCTLQVFNYSLFHCSKAQILLKANSILQWPKGCNAHKKKVKLRSVVQCFNKVLKCSPGDCFCLFLYCRKLALANWSLDVWKLLVGTELRKWQRQM